MQNLFGYLPLKGGSTEKAGKGAQDCEDKRSQQKIRSQIDLYIEDRYSGEGDEDKV